MDQHARILLLDRACTHSTTAYKEVELMKKDISKILADKFSIEKSEGRFLFTKVKITNYLNTATYLAELGFTRLLTVSAVDWIKKAVFEIYFIVHNFDENVYIKVSTEIPRDDPKIPTLYHIWKNASMHEREMWELFGIEFDGNQMLKPLFLEDWIGPPPFRKDFNWREHVKSTN